MQRREGNQPELSVRRDPDAARVTEKSAQGREHPRVERPRRRFGRRVGSSQHGEQASDLGVDRSRQTEVGDGNGAIALEHKRDVTKDAARSRGRVSKIHLGVTDELDEHAPFLEPRRDR